ncbi:unnamed protein product, partial [Hapterophycus canaliculatus]
AAAAAAREEAGCTLWDMSADENNASAMCSAGLTAVSCAVLRHCADAEAAAAEEARAGSPFPGEEGSAGGSSESAAAAAAATDAAPRLPPGERGAERLREVTCGLLANVCSHRSLRPQVAGNPALGEELLRAFHSTDDPASLTELLRLFSTAALMTTTASAAEKSDPAAADGGDSGPSGSSGSSSSPGATVAAAAATGIEEGTSAAATIDKDNGGGGVAGVSREACGSGDADGDEAAGAPAPKAEEAASLTSGLAARVTLERLGFFLENALEERLLAW